MAAPCSRSSQPPPRKPCWRSHAPSIPSPLPCGSRRRAPSRSSRRPRRNPRRCSAVGNSPARSDHGLPRGAHQDEGSPGTPVRWSLPYTAVPLDPYRRPRTATESENPPGRGVYNDGFTQETSLACSVEPRASGIDRLIPSPCRQEGDTGGDRKGAPPCPAV
jgi:hypothetical protein